MDDQHSALLTVAAIMTPSVASVKMDDSLGSVARLFDDHGFDHAIVIEGDRCVGVISDRDLLRTISPFVGTDRSRAMDEFTASKRVHQVMSRHPVSVTRETSIALACEKMVEFGIHCLPVLDGEGRPEGIVTSGDVMRWTARQLGIWLERRPAA